ncbi:DUF924 family protein [Leptolyngbya sp. AN02str]|uniref:DUF924 family protein n=1 Tax=Leptolyngbya sp. AN02str TaxID=3423363 RepID=UPI003D31D4C1
MAEVAEIHDILLFWFGDANTEESHYEQRRKLWFRKQDETDDGIRQRFLSTYDQATSGALDGWATTPEGALALILVLDQFPRNMFRDTAQAFATDAKALAIAKQAISQGFDQQLAPIQRIFLYLPLEHSEDVQDQFQSVVLFRTLHQAAPELTDVYDYALRHREVIAQFGRFPHRNRILGRTSTPEEIEFLKQPGSSF